MTISTAHDLFTAVREGFDYGAIDGTTPPDVLRDFYAVADDVSDEEIERVFTSVFNGQSHSVLVAVSLGNGKVFGSKAIDPNGGPLDEDIDALSSGMSHDIGASIALGLIRSDEDSSDAHFRLFLMPEGRYDAGHGEHVERYGRVVGIHRNRTTRQAA
jgi:hypothetical protein